MTWEEKLAAIKSLSGDVALCMRYPGNWYVLEKGIEIGDGATLLSMGCTGSTPEDAVNQTWGKLTGLKYDKAIVVHAGTNKRRHVRWNGYMWDDVDDPRGANKIPSGV